MATAASDSDFPLATDDPFAPDNGHGSANAGGEVNDAAGASGGNSGSGQLSQGALIAIIVVVSVVAVLGVSTAVLFYLAKKREWKVRENIRRSAKKVVTALTPRRSEFPRSVKEYSSSSRGGRTRLDDVPPTPRLRPEDLEKGLKAEVRRSPDGGGRGGGGGGKKKWPRM